jgi:hypothetical protein
MSWGLSARILLLKFGFLIVAFGICLIITMLWYRGEDPIYVLLLTEVSAVGAAILLIEGVFYGIESFAHRVERTRFIDDLVGGISERIGIDLSNENNALILSNYRGIRRVTRNFDAAYVRGFVETSSRLDILNTWLPSEALFDMIRMTLEKADGHVRLLLANRTSEYVLARSVTLERDVASLIEACYNELYIMHRSLKERGLDMSRLQLRLYDSAPPCSICGAGDETFIGIFGVDALAIDSFQLQFRRSSEIGGQIWPQFERMWSRSSVNVELEVPFMQWGYSQ